MQVIICDDEFSTCVQLENYIEKYSQEHFIKADIDVFYDGESLCEYLKSSSSVDLLFLDIELPKCNGVEVGKYIREKLENEETEIIYISLCYETFSMQTDGFSCKTHYFSNGRENFRYSDEERTCEQKKNNG